MVEKIIESLKKDFKEFSGECLGILFYGSYVRGEDTERSDIDVCVVKPSKETFNRILERLGGKYDIKVFEELPLYVRVDVIRNHIKIYANKNLE